MPYVHVRQNTGNYDAWKQVFDKSGDARLEAGSKGAEVFRSATDPNEVVVLLEWDEVDLAQTFAQSKEFQQMLQGGGGKGQPDVLVLNETDDPVT